VATSIAEINFDSPALGRRASYMAILPGTGPGAGSGPFHLLYQLHGRSDDHRAWIERSNLARHVDGLPMIVVVPNGEVSFWANLNPLLRMEDFLLEDLDEHVRRTFRVREGKCAVGGLSMGGYGALRLALRHPDRFASTWAHSSRIPTRKDIEEEFWFADVVAKGEQDEIDLETVLDRALDRVGVAGLPKIGMDCGTDDHLLENSRRFRAALDRRKVPHRYAEHPGAHTWDYWDLHVKTALRYHLEALQPAGA
jgi:putative tributyrin esterase